MMRKIRTPWTIAAGLAALAVILLMAAGCANLSAKLTPGASQTERYSSAVSKISSPLQVSMIMRGRPALGATVDVDLSVKSSLPAPATTMTLTVPVASVEFVAGETRAANIQSAEDPYYGSVTQAAWPLSLAQDQAQSMTAALRITQNGYYNIHAYAFTDLGAGGRYGGRADLYLVIDGTEVWVGSQPPKNNWVSSNIGMPGVSDPSHVGELDVRVYLTEPLQWGKETELVYEITSLVDITDRVSIGLILPKVGLTVVGREDPDQESLSFLPPKTLENRAQSSDPNFAPPEPGSLMRWEGYLNKGYPAVIRLKIKPTATGEGGITAYINAPSPNGTGTLLYYKSLHLSVYTPSSAE